MKIRFVTLSTFLFLLTISYTQEIRNIYSEQVGKQIHIYYDLEGEGEYNIQVFCSSDNGQTWGQPLKHITGAIGETQKSGTGKVVIWDVLNETNELTGNISFKINAKSPSKASAPNGFSGDHGTFIDERDGQEYNWVRIGKQIWMAKNLNVGKIINGRGKQKDNGLIEKYCYENRASYCEVFGGLYQWPESMNYNFFTRSQGICPEGWHIPDEEEWNTLLIQLGGEKIAGGKMKEKGTDHMRNKSKKVYSNKGATNSSGFTAIGSGFRSSSHSHWDALYELAFFRESTSSKSYVVRAHDVAVVKNRSDKNAGFSVRCIKDNQYQ